LPVDASSRRPLDYWRNRESAEGVFLRQSHQPELYMAEGYCVQCKAKKEIAAGIEEIMKNGRKAIKGRCPACGTVMFKILGGKATSPPSPPPSSSTPPAAN